MVHLFSFILKVFIPRLIAILIISVNAVAMNPTSDVTVRTPNPSKGFDSLDIACVQLGIQYSEQNKLHVVGRIARFWAAPSQAGHWNFTGKCVFNLAPIGNRSRQYESPQQCWDSNGDTQPCPNLD
jgi:hypothetical protein